MMRRAEFKDMQPSQRTHTPEPEFTVFMLLKIAPECLGFTVACARELAREALAPILQQHAATVTLGYFDMKFVSDRVTDIWIWRARDVQAYQRLLADLRAEPFWDRYFKVVEILAGLEEAQARKYYRRLLPALADADPVEAELGPVMQDVA